MVGEIGEHELTFMNTFQINISKKVYPAAGGEQIQMDTQMSHLFYYAMFFKHIHESSNIVCHRRQNKSKCTHTNVSCVGIFHVYANKYTG